jgi:hypothetical protein
MNLIHQISTLGIKSGVAYYDTPNGKIKLKMNCIASLSMINVD